MQHPVNNQGAIGRYSCLMIKSHVISSFIFACLFVINTSDAQQSGVASYYADFFQGRKMANGERYDAAELTCAHPTAPIGSLIKVVMKNDPDRSVIVTVSDRGPYVKGRIIDLSKRAAEELGILEEGIADVVIGFLRKPEMNRDGYFVLSDSQD
jgi:rare lipoprotein A